VGLRLALFFHRPVCPTVDSTDSPIHDIREASERSCSMAGKLDYQRCLPEHGVGLASLPAKNSPPARRPVPPMKATSPSLGEEEYATAFRKRSTRLHKTTGDSK